MKSTLSKTKRFELKTISQIYLEEMSKPPYNEKWTLRKAKEKMKFFLKFYDLYTIQVEKEIIGFIVINPKFMCPGEVAFGEELVIKESFQKKGIGKEIMEKIIKIYKEKKFPFKRFKIKL